MESLKNQQNVISSKPREVKKLASGKVNMPYDLNEKSWNFIFSNNGKTTTLQVEEKINNKRIIRGSEKVPLENFNTELSKILDKYLGKDRIKIPEKGEEVVRLLTFKDVTDINHGETVKQNTIFFGQIQERTKVRSVKIKELDSKIKLLNNQKDILQDEIDELLRRIDNPKQYKLFDSIIKLIKNGGYVLERDEDDTFSSNNDNIEINTNWNPIDSTLRYNFSGRKFQNNNFGYNIEQAVAILNKNKTFIQEGLKNPKKLNDKLKEIEIMTAAVSDIFDTKSLIYKEIKEIESKKHELEYEGIEEDLLNDVVKKYGNTKGFDKKTLKTIQPNSDSYQYAMFCDQNNVYPNPYYDNGRLDNRDVVFPLEKEGGEMQCIGYNLYKNKKQAFCRSEYEGYRGCYEIIGIEDITSFVSKNNESSHNNIWLDEYYLYNVNEETKINRKTGEKIKVVGLQENHKFSFTKK